MKTAIINIGEIVSGDWRNPILSGNAVLMDGEHLTKVGEISQDDIESCDLVIDANGVTACPGLIDSHVHIAFGDYAPRFASTGFLKDYLYGGTTTAISASEVHVPGRPSDPAGVKALAVAAKKCWDNVRPGGMRVYGGNIILEPGLTDADFADAAAQGIWLAKAGFGSVQTPFDYVPLIAAAKRAGMITNIHTGGASLSIANSITGDHLIAIQPDVAFHVNGGPIAMQESDFPRVVDQTSCALQICQAGNIKTAVLTLNLVLDRGCFDRFLIATDTPTGVGVMPQGMIKSVAEMACLSDAPAAWMIAAATGNVAAVYRLNSGILAPGRDADLLLIDAPAGGSMPTALTSIKYGDYPAGVGAFTAGIPRYLGRSRCTPPPKRLPHIIRNRVLQEFAPLGLLH